jgi:hypothetical protein
VRSLPAVASVAKENQLIFVDHVKTVPGSHYACYQRVVPFAVLLCRNTFCSKTVCAFWTYVVGQVLRYSFWHYFVHLQSVSAGRWLPAPFAQRDSLDGLAQARFCVCHYISHDFFAKKHKIIAVMQCSNAMQ